MRKGRDREGWKKWNGKWKIMVKIVATNVVARQPPNGDRLQRRPLVPILKLGDQAMCLMRGRLGQD